MAVTVRPISDDDLAGVAEFLHAHLNERVPAAAWLRAFTPPWAFEQPNHGFMLVDDAGEIVGAYAALYSERTIGDRQERVCNWPPGACARTSGSTASACSRRLAQERLHVHRPLAEWERRAPQHPSRLHRARHRHRARAHAALAAPVGRAGEPDPDVIDTALTGDQRDLYRDHAGLAAARHLVLFDGDRSCWVVFRMDRRKKLPPVFASILHVSDQDLFRRRIRTVGSHLLLHHRAAALLAEQRVTGTLDVWPRFTLGAPRRKMFPSSTMSVDEVDYFYSDLTCLSW